MLWCAIYVIHQITPVKPTDEIFLKTPTVIAWTGWIGAAVAHNIDDCGCGTVPQGGGIVAWSHWNLLLPLVMLLHRWHEAVEA